MLVGPCEDACGSHSHLLSCLCSSILQLCLCPPTPGSAGWVWPVWPVLALKRGLHEMVLDAACWAMLPTPTSSGGGHAAT